MPAATADIAVAATLPSGDTRVSAARWFASLSLHLLLFLAALGLGALAAGNWPVMFAAALLAAFATVQLGYHGHDFEHGQVAIGAHHRRACSLLLWNLLLGVSADWWRDKHGRHHRDTHVVGQDPDLYDLFVYEAAQFESLPPLRRWLAAHQHWWFWPLTSLARLHYYACSLRHAAGMSRERGRELGLLLAHHLLLVGTTAALLGWRALAFLLVMQLATGLYLGVVFGLNHLGMPHPAAVAPGRDWQAGHTRNVRGGPWLDYFMGGLNLQIEHHLHPNLSRRALRAIQPSVEAQCRLAGLRYERTGLLEGIVAVTASLRRVARECARR